MRLFDVLLAVVFVSALFMFVSLMFVTAPYGRHARAGWGPEIGSRLAWWIMEVPASLGFALFFFAGEHSREPVPLALFLLWQLHYFDRAFLYPLRIRVGRRTTPLATVASGFAYNCINAFLNGTSLSAVTRYEPSWFGDPRFLLGVALFLAGWTINRWADTVLRNLRRPGETGYAIPRGGLYEAISCPNYFGELIEWVGWAVATWSLAGLSFAVFSAANLLPRAVANHNWYQEQFPDYPPRRRAVIPFVW